MTDSATTTPLEPLPLVPSAPPQALQAKRQADAFMATAEALVVDSPLMFDQAAGELVRIRERWKAVEAQRVHLKEPFLEGCRRIDAFFKEPLDRLAAAGDTIKTAMAAFREAEDRRIAEARRLEEERQQAERAELARRQREADEAARAAREESDRVAREAAEAARLEREESDRVAAAARAEGNEAAARAAEAEAAERQRIAAAEADAARQRALEAEQAATAEAEQAQQAMDLADVAPPMPVVASGAVARGVSGRKSWKLKSVDKRALVLGVAARIQAGDDSWLEFLDVNESALGKLAQALKGATRVDGCVFGEVTSIATTGRGR